MKKCERKLSLIFIIIGIVAFLAAVATVVGVMVYRIEKRRKDDEELERYIETAIE